MGCSVSRATPVKTLPYKQSSKQRNDSGTKTDLAGMVSNAGGMETTKQQTSHNDREIKIDDIAIAVDPNPEKQRSQVYKKSRITFDQIDMFEAVSEEDSEPKPVENQSVNAVEPPSNQEIRVTEQSNSSNQYNSTGLLKTIEEVDSARQRDSSFVHKRKTAVSRQESTSQNSLAKITEYRQKNNRQWALKQKDEIKQEGAEDFFYHPYKSLRILLEVQVQLSKP